jgi:hypothetical protein
MNQAEFHELQHEQTVKEFDRIWEAINIKDECDMDVLKRIEQLESTRIVVTISRVAWWKEYLILTAVLFMGFLIALACIDMRVIVL